MKIQAAVLLTVSSLFLGAQETDRDKLQGTWQMVSLEVGGQKVVPTEKLKAAFKGDKFDHPRLENDMVFKLDATKTPRAIDVTPPTGPAKGKTLLGIYELQGDTLKICLSIRPDTDRPTNFAGKEKGQIVYNFMREGK